MGRQSRRKPENPTPATAVNDSDRKAAWWSSEARSSLTSGLVVASIPAIAAVWSVYQVSRGDRDTTMLVLRTLNIPAAVISTLYYFAPFLIAALFALAFNRIMKSNPGTDRRIKGAIWLSVLTVISASLPLIYTLAITAIGAALTPRSSGPARMRSAGTNHPPYAEIIAFAGLPLMLILTQQPMWLPHESIKTRNDPNGVTVYVLDSGDHYLTVLYENFQPEIIGQDEVLERRLCRIEPSGSGKIIDILYSTVFFRAKLGELEQLPACPIRKSKEHPTPHVSTSPSQLDRDPSHATPTPSVGY
ncbi:hypothetical protein AB0M91_07790 [Micromonospora rifamycinica]|uniref:hypothetical protein n=1 Tax=Micromonospora rifamycinica TaxID=291594 RepID=UPI0034315279